MDFKRKLERAFSLEKERLKSYTEEDILPFTFEKLLREGKNKIDRAGFLILDLNGNSKFDGLKPNEILTKLGELVGLDEPVVPSQYNKKEINTLFVGKVNRIKYSNNGIHTNFEGNTLQKVHSDGTLDQFNKIKTAFLYCHHPSEQGGENTIYNVIGILYDITQSEDNKLEPLFKKDALTKFSPFRENIDVTDSAFSFDKFGKIISRYSDSDEYCRWSEKLELREVLEIFRKKLKSNGAPLRKIKIKLKKGQILILENNKVVHDRSKFNIERVPREVWRAVYEKGIVESLENIKI